jgi:hypothetical protein
MLPDEILIEKARALIEVKTGWGNSQYWTNQDFIALSEKIQDETGITLSHVTLKRLWGKVRYESMPNIHTLDTLVKFVGYENWRQFKLQQTDVSLPVTPAKQNLATKYYTRIGIALLLVILMVCVSLFIPERKTKIDPDDFRFSSRKVVTQGVPNSVIFEVGASKAPGDSVIIQQSWDKNRQAKISRELRQHTSIYYFPEFVRAKLIVDNQVVKEHELFITSDGWLPMVEHSPVPLYFKKEDAIQNGEMSLSIEKIKSKNISMQPDVPKVMYANVRDFGEIYTDNFAFETSVRNDFKEGTSVCQLTTIYLLCECDGKAIGIPLSAKGCVSDTEVLFMDHYASGKQNDLSAFGVDFDDMVKIGVEVKNDVGKVFINNALVYTVAGPIAKAKIIGLYFIFQGTGTVDYVTLSNDRTSFKDDF